MDRPILINLGIDFGTRFTKVCARSEGVGVAVCDFNGDGVDGAVLSSAVELRTDGVASVPAPGRTPDENRAIQRPKMALAARTELELGPSIEGRFDQTPVLISALAAFYLSSVIGRAKSWIEEHWRLHIGSREITWSANVGLPVAICDSPTAPVFQEVMSVAWQWAEQGFGGGTIPELVDAYEKCDARANPKMSPCQIYPEIAAAVLSFATSRSVVPGIYIYFDIGGGTLDGVAFNVRRQSGDVLIDFYSGNVESLGIDAIADEVSRRLAKEGEFEASRSKIKRILLETSSHQTSRAFRSYILPVRKLIAGVIVEAKRKDSRDWRSGSFQDLIETESLRRFLSVDEGRLKPLKIFIGGGGVGSPFYHFAIGGTYENFKHGNYGIPPYSLIEVPPPPDLEMGSIDAHAYHRFLVAYGLSVPFGEGPEFQLPSAFDIIPPPKKAAPVRVGDYLDSKDIYD